MGIPFSCYSKKQQLLTAANQEPAKIQTDHDVAIIGGGLAGLALAIQTARQGHRVILFEKEQYPFHKVCGEYISLESWEFLKQLGIDLEQMQLPVIRRLQVTATNGTMLEQDLPLGGFGIRRFLIDDMLDGIEQQSGVLILENTKVNELEFTGDSFVIEASGRQYNAKLVCGCFGKRSNIDIKWKRPFTTAPKNRLNNYIGVKYHIQTAFPSDTIALHNFKHGYCGIVAVEDDKYNLCYLTTARNLQQNGNSIVQMEQNVLMQNPHLKNIFAASRFLFDTPLTISQISFDKKTQADRHVLMLGDAAGMITPLCGNGMSMALHASKLAANQVQLFLQGKISRLQMETDYTRDWQTHFSKRLRTGRAIQKILGQEWLAGTFLSICRKFPNLLSLMIRQTHGKPF